MLDQIAPENPVLISFCRVCILFGQILWRLKKQGLQRIRLVQVKGHSTGKSSAGELTGFHIRSKGLMPFIETAQKSPMRILKR